MIEVNGGSGNYIFEWSDPQIPTGNLSAGTYTITITDSDNGCTLIETFEINEPEELGIEILASTSEEATAEVSGGTPSYLSLIHI